ncbi:sensor domain-containing diguanylate cyclase [Methyloferula stellata]|uniref:sensor domain-containing diguanylate cyclase n=1 Tax=Methyloferula stellata TaxID=876270 RepID=UPI001FCA8363|nr:sensor domain-containing diguanylate cyclase [Methyloferula stellata]
MREHMAALINSQLDFIFFFYGLAFILLGSTCFAIAREAGRGEPWDVLGLFAFLHGAGEWLDLAALDIADTPLFAVMRTALMAISFLLLMEFARMNAIRFGLRAPARWLFGLYLPLLLLVVFAGTQGGTATANAVARYAIGFPAAIAAASVFAWFAKGFLGTARHLAIFAAMAFVLYAFAAGIIVTVAPFWPADTINQDWFVQLTGIPIQLVRGLLACALALTIWAIWRHQLVLKVASERYTAFLHQQFIWTLAAMGIILVCGWILTEFLGGIYKQNAEMAARADIDLIASHLAAETAPIEAMVKSFAGAPSVQSLLGGASADETERVKSMLDLDVEASGAKLGMIFDGSGRIVMSSGQKEMGAVPLNAGSAPYFLTSLAGELGRYFAFDAAAKELDFYASYPIRGRVGEVVGVAALQKSLSGFDADLREFDRPYFFVDPNGVIVLTNQPKMLLRPFWPLTPYKAAALAVQYGTLNDRPLMKREVEDGTWTQADGERNYLRRRFVHASQWSLVILNPTQEIFASRILGIVITFLTTIMALIYLFGRERWMRDKVEVEKRLELQKLARDLKFQATTDPLTGLSNRLQFDQGLANEMLRSERYETPLSLVLYDIDHFKDINDTYGHQTGDKVLVDLSQFVAARIRSTDLLARWGGEEFVLVLPGTDSAMAYLAAEKLRDDVEKTAFDGLQTVTCSFGVAQFAVGDTAESFIDRADAALYQAKISGRNRVKLAPKSAAEEGFVI